ncbi:hypothetical protein PGN35_018370 [Nodosilinea sp. PGN35]|uniref:hypothetical protein n=1 Tax=Nodosilinea sp. PGN35 TaxID=3020489 RepID=UPI0023B285B2|nr:hypothetical protein [Nodosilinea sp. TSF1-S3]MDF0364705.1 hypothetical protein [Nodosilinea sp. TSF1-S3]
MASHLLIDILLGLIVLTARLNIVNGYAQSLIDKTSFSIRTALINLTTIFIPLLIDIAFFEIKKFPEIPSFATIPITSFATATGVFLVNLELENKKQKREKLKIAKILVCAIEPQIEELDSFQKALKENKIYIEPGMYDLLGEILVNKEISALILNNAGIFSIEIIRDLMGYSDQLNKNLITILLVNQEIKTENHLTLNVEKKNGELMMEMIQKTVSKGAIALQNICENTMRDKERAEKYSRLI